MCKQRKGRGSSAVGVQSSLEKVQTKKEGARKLNSKRTTTERFIVCSWLDLLASKRILMIYPIDRASDFHRVDSPCDCALSLKERLRETFPLFFFLRGDNKDASYSRHTEMRFSLSPVTICLISTISVLKFDSCVYVENKRFAIYFEFNKYSKFTLEYCISTSFYRCWCSFTWIDKFRS